MHRSERGFSLLETLVSIALTAVVVLGLAVGLLTTVRSSEVAASVQRSDSALSSFSESLRAMPYPDSFGGPCPTAADYEAAYAAFASRWSDPAVSLDFIGIEHWDPTTGDFGSACPSVGDPSLHRLSVGVTVDGDETVSQVVVGTA